MKKLSNAVCYHEAAHVVARSWAGLPLCDVVVNSNGEGFTYGTNQTITLAGQYGVWDMCVYALAGPYAEARISRKSRVAVLLSNGWDDYTEAKEAIEWLCQHAYASEEKAAWQRAEEQTRQYLRAYWPQIEAVALALRRSGRLSGDECLQILRGMTTQITTVGNELLKVDQI